MNYSEIKNYDIANGEGVRVSLFVSGCRHHCLNCFNEIAWSFQGGEPYTDATKERILEMLKPDYISGLSLLGGEPFEPENQSDLLRLTQAVHGKYPEKSIWCYSGFTWEELTGQKPSRARTENCLPLLSTLDVLVDGPFVEELKDITLALRGSSNQRIVDVKKSLDSGQIISRDLHFGFEI